MKIQIQSVHFDMDIKLQEFIDAKVTKLISLYDRIESCKVILKLNKNNKNRNKVAEINLDIPGNRLFAKDQSESFEESFDMAYEEIKKQLLGRKEKLSERSKSGADITG